MGKYAVLTIKESEDELDIYRKKYSGTKFLKRISALKFIKSKRFRTRQELSIYLGIDKRTLERWISKYCNLPDK